MTLTLRLVSSLLLFGLLAGCGAREVPGSGPVAASAQEVSEVSDTPTFVEAQPQQQLSQHHYRNALTQRRVRHRHSSPR